MAEVTIIQLTRDELKELIRSSILEALNEGRLPLESQANTDSLLKIDEVSKILKVSKVTIHNWKKKGRIPFHRISNRIFFKKSEIIESLKKVNALKFQQKW